MITHKQIYTPRSKLFGGVRNGTLCGRVDRYNNIKNDGMNVAEGEDYTCKLCKKMAQKRWGKILIERSEQLRKEQNVR